ncbi:hypothetical protein KSS87_019861 [Heliosperma pusillum]|nr:hypothetical protein KSS87_019861 [Heliosperma pusillum]
MGHRKVSWSDLPEELLIPIVDRLENRHDILHVRSVCKEWRRCISLSLVSNKRVLSTLLPHKLKTINRPLSRGGAIFRGSDFYVAIEEVNSGKVLLRRPLSRSVVREILWDSPKLLDLSRFEVEEMGKIYSLRSDKNPNHLFDEEHKVLMLADPNDCKRELTIDDYTVVVLYDTGTIAAINLGSAQVQQVFSKASKFDDICNNKFVLISQVAINRNDESVPKQNDETEVMTMAIAYLGRMLSSVTDQTTTTERRRRDDMVHFQTSKSQTNGNEYLVTVDHADDGADDGVKHANFPPMIGLFAES